MGGASKPSRSRTGRRPSKSLASKSWAVQLLWSVSARRELVYALLMVACIMCASRQDHLHRIETTTTTPARFLWAKPHVVHRPFDARKLEQLDHLILVAGHAVLDPHTESLESADKRESTWYLMDYQRNQDLPRVLVSHIQRGIQEAAQDPKSLLVFS